ncbi:MAG: restriction endonuclease subunit S, partial [Deltaproteobacteria bacterium]|nr:restriction endonuclease subunit S [Deltaproteobacteria bacterium]
MNPDSVPSASSACYAVLQYFDQISEAPDAITCLRRLILDLAVRGKLVEQVPNEEPTSKLLKRIEEENSRLFKEGAIRVQQPLPPIEPRDIAFEIPKTWKWVQIETIAHVEMGQSPSSEFYNQHREGLPFYQGKADFGKIHPTPRYWCTAPTKLAEKDDILISVRAPVGPTNIATEMCCIGRGLAALRPYQGYERDFFLICLKKFAPDLESLGAGTTFVAIGRKHLVTFIV